MEIVDYKNFFDDFINFKKIQNDQKASGLNDFNLLTTVLKYHDEVRLHSRMIGALLDPNGKHYQGTLFLEKFIKEINLTDFNMDLSNVTVGIEYKDIDLYITDGSKHIIIENKIWAGDQPCQVMKYINIIVEENKEDFGSPSENDILDENKLRVIYLTPRKYKVVPKEHRLDGKYIDYDCDYDSEALDKCSAKMRNRKTIDFNLVNYKAMYQKIDYKNNILNWLKNSLVDIKEIANLRESIGQYINVIEMVNKDYKGKVMTLEEYMNKNDYMYDFLKEVDNVKNKIETNFWNELDERLHESDLIDKYKINYKFKSDYKYKPEIKLISKSDENKYIYIRRDHNTFLGFHSNEEDTNKLLEYYNNDGKPWVHTRPKINFQKPNDEYWKIAKPNYRQECIENIFKQIKSLDEELMLTI